MAKDKKSHKKAKDDSDVSISDVSDLDVSDVSTSSVSDVSVPSDVSDSDGGIALLLL